MTATTQPAPDGSVAPAALTVLVYRTSQLEALTRPVPCAARPSTTFVHRDGSCRCFIGGPAPEFTTPAHPVHRLPFAS